MTEDAIKLLRDPGILPYTPASPNNPKKVTVLKTRLTYAKNTFWISTKGHRRKIFLFLRTKDFPVVIPTALTIKR